MGNFEFPTSKFTEGKSTENPNLISSFNTKSSLIAVRLA